MELCTLTFSDSIKVAFKAYPMLLATVFTD